MAAHGRKIHYGKCRRQLQELHVQQITFSDSDNEADPQPEAMDILLDDLQQPQLAEEQHMPPELPPPPAPALLPVHSFRPFLSPADADMAAMYVKRFDLSIGTLDKVLEIAQRGEEIAGTTKELLERIDSLPGMGYRCAEMTLPGFDDRVYRLFFRDLKSGVDFLLSQHGSVLLRPQLRPADAQLEEMWHGARYQQLYREFCAHAAPTDVLLPLIFYSGAVSLSISCLACTLSC